MNFPLSHISSLCKYTGISFTAGAITHGFFSGERAIWTAAFGIAIYLVGGILEKIANPDKDHSWTDVLVIGIVDNNANNPNIGPTMVFIGVSNLF